MPWVGVHDGTGGGHDGAKSETSHGHGVMVRQSLTLRYGPTECLRVPAIGRSTLTTEIRIEAVKLSRKRRVGSDPRSAQGLR